MEKATKDAETAKAALKETSKKAQDAEKERSTLESQMKSLRSAFEAEQAAGRKLGDKVEATNATLALREQEIAKLTERLGKGARTTAYERLLTEDLDLAGMPTREETSTP